MENDMSSREEVTKPAAAAELPQEASTVTPEAVLVQLRGVQLGEVTPLTNKQRRALRNQVYTANAVLQASINVIGALDLVAQAVGQKSDDVRQMYDEANRWTAVEDELRAMLNGVAGANLIRRQRIAVIAGQSYSVGSQLARNPAHAVLVPHVQEVKRLKGYKRRKKAAPAPGSQPSPAPATQPAHGPATSAVPQA
jgi:surface antigen